MKQTRQAKLPYRLPGRLTLGAVLPRLFVGALLGLVGLSLASQEAASALKYAPALGAPLLYVAGDTIGWSAIVLGLSGGVVGAARKRIVQVGFGASLAALGWILLSGAVYSPFAIIGWTARFAHNSDALGALLVPLCAGTAFLAFGTFLLTSTVKEAVPAKHSEHLGKARLATSKEIQDAGLFAREGIPFGIHEGKRLRSSDPVHMLLMAPTRSGKGLGIVQPGLLEWSGGALVADMKGENYQLTAGYRHNVLGQRCFRLAPVAESGPRARYNPLLFLSRREELILRDAQSVAGFLIEPAKGGSDSSQYFKDTARAALAAVIIRIIELYGDEATLVHAAGFFSQGRIPALEDLAESPVSFVQTQAALLRQRSQNEFGSIIGTLNQAMSIFEDPLVARTVSGSDFTPEDLVDGEIPASVYLEIPEAEQHRLAPFLRVVIQQILGRLMQDVTFDACGPTEAHRHELLFMLDEFPSLGRMDFFVNALRSMAGYGCRAVIVAQSLSDLYRVYGKEDNGILGNCSIVVAYAPNDETTAKYLSTLASKSTIARTSRRKNSDPLGGLLQGGSVSTEYNARDLFDIGDLRTLPIDTQVIFVNRLQPILAEKIFRPKDPLYRERAQIPAPIEDSLS